MQVSIWLIYYNVYVTVVAIWRRIAAALPGTLTVTAEGGGGGGGLCLFSAFYVRCRHVVRFTCRFTFNGSRFGGGGGGGLGFNNGKGENVYSPMHQF